MHTGQKTADLGLSLSKLNSVLINVTLFSSGWEKHLGIGITVIPDKHYDMAVTSVYLSVKWTWTFTIIVLS